MEFPEVGDRCSQDGCGQLDFLPIRCTYCSHWFCKDHHLTHTCPERPDNVVSVEDESKPKERWQFKCSFSDCNIKELVSIKCPKCDQHFCLQHRHPDQHRCQVESAEEKSKSSKKSINPIVEQQNKIKEQISEKLDDVKGKGGSKGAMAAKLALMKLKGRAEGDKAIPQTERIYFIISCPNTEQNPKPLDMFMSKTYTMGKVIDVVARRARIKNRNNIADNTPKLHLFKGDLCLSNPFDRTIAQLINDNVLEDGDAISMKYHSN